MTVCLFSIDLENIYDSVMVCEEMSAFIGKVFFLAMRPVAVMFIEFTFSANLGYTRSEISSTI